MESQFDVFISYSSKEFENVSGIRNILEKNNIKCWMAPHSIPMGSSYAEEIPIAIKNCKVFLLMISNVSQQSKWVPKEVSLAVKHEKIVLPFMLEDCELTQSFDFFLSDVQRFNAFESQTELLKNLVQRISSQVKLSDPPNKLTTISDKEQLLVDKTANIYLADSDNDMNEIINWIMKKESFIIDRKLASFPSKIRGEYQKKPDAQHIQKLFTNYYIESFQLEKFLSSLFEMAIYNNNAAEIDIQMAIIYIHSGEKFYIKQARIYLERAIAILSKSSSYDEIRFKKIVYTKWLLAVTYKQERNYGQASDLCEELIHFINDENKIFEVPFVDTLLLPQRELAVITKERVLFDYLILRTEDISYNVKELFFTQRRTFEFYLLHNDFNAAKKLLPNLLDSFSKCERQVEAIYQIALYQNLFEYYMYIGDKEKSQQYYKLAYHSAKKNFWKGKQQKLEDIKSLYE